MTVMRFLFNTFSRRTAHQLYNTFQINNKLAFKESIEYQQQGRRRTNMSLLFLPFRSYVLRLSLTSHTCLSIQYTNNYDNTRLFTCLYNIFICLQVVMTFYNVSDCKQFITYQYDPLNHTRTNRHSLNIYVTLTDSYLYIFTYNLLLSAL